MSLQNFFKGAWLLSALVLFAGCGSSRQMLSPKDWEARKDVHSEATIYVSDVDFKTRIVDKSEEKLTLVHNGIRTELPMEVVSKIIFSEDDAKMKKIVWGGVIGGVVGMGAGYLAGHAASNENTVTAAMTHPVSMALILGGITGGALIGSGLTKYQEYEFNQGLNPYILHGDVGAEITPAEMKNYSIFENLTSDPDEKILQVQIFKLNSGNYFLLYDAASLGTYSVKWQIVNEDYIQTQKAKIKTQK